MAKYRGFDKVAFGHVSITDESDINLYLANVENRVS
jgi:hypothetical protein